MPTIDSFNLYDPTTGKYNELKVSTKFTELKNTVTLVTDSSFVDIGITNFNPLEDILDVVKNTTSINEGTGTDEYILNGGNLRIENPDGLWLSGTKFHFRVLKNVDRSPLPSYDPSLFEDGGFTKAKLAQELQNELDLIPMINTQLADIIKKTTSFVHVEQFPIIPPETNDAPRIQRAIDYCIENDVRNLLFADKTYNINSKLIINHYINLWGSTTVLTVLNFNVPNDWGLSVEGQGIGGSSTDGIIIEGFNLKGTAKAFLHIYGTALHRVNRIISQQSSSCVFYLDSCQDYMFNDIDVFDGGNPNTGKEGSILHIKNCNNHHYNYFRCEVPKTYAIYSECGGSFNIGKVDGNAWQTSTKPYVVADNSPIVFNDFHFDGAIAEIAEIIGYGSFEFNKVLFNRSNCNAIVKATNTSYVHMGEGYQPGVIYTPKVKFKNCKVVAESDNIAGQNIKSLVYAKAPDTRYMPNNSSKFDLSSSFVQDDHILGVLQYDVDGVLTAPSVNDQYVGTYLTHKQTGKKARIYTNTAGGNTYIDSVDTVSFPNGTIYQLEYNEQNGVIVEVDNMEVQYRTRKSVFTPFFKVNTATVNATLWDATNFYTVVGTTGTYTNSELKGMYLVNKSTEESYLILDNAGGNLYVAYDQSAKIVNGDYDIVAGNSQTTIQFKYTN